MVRLQLQYDGTGPDAVLEWVNATHSKGIPREFLDIHPHPISPELKQLLANARRAEYVITTDEGHQVNIWDAEGVNLGDLTIGGVVPWANLDGKLELRVKTTTQDEVFRGDQLAHY